MANSSSKRKRAAPQDASEGDEREAASQVKRFRYALGCEKPQTSSFADTITVFAGDDKVASTVHTDKLRAKSEYFKAACQREWAEGQKKTVELPEIRPETFDIYTTWAYFGKIDIEVLGLIEEHPDKLFTHESKEERQIWIDSTMSLIRLHVASDYLGDKELKRRTIDGLISVIGARRTLHMLRDVLSYIWNSTPPKAGLRKFLLDYVVSRRGGIHEWLRERENDLPSEFFVDLAIHHLKASHTAHSKPQVEPSLARKHMYYDGYESGSND
ncbi:hypothetical protein LTR27_008300 [Elasticomyces elasticus]|nr:hypothetical protein LTR27_008300 [Elasticomyces elasticus]